MLSNLNEFEFTAQIGMCGGGGITFRKESFCSFIDEEDGEEYWVFDSLQQSEGYVWSLWLHYTGIKAMAIVGDGREKELKELALEALNEAARGEWANAKAIVNSWENNPMA